MLLAAALLALVAGCGRGDDAASPVEEGGDGAPRQTAGDLLPAGAGQEPAPPPQWERPELDLDAGQAEELRTR
ncbi:hypothetical protein, partial [Novilysobacter defluvii]